MYLICSVYIYILYAGIYVDQEELLVNVDNTYIIYAIKDSFGFPLLYTLYFSCISSAYSSSSLNCIQGIYRDIYVFISIYTGIYIYVFISFKHLPNISSMFPFVALPT